MLKASITFFIIAILAFVLGAYGIAGLSIEIGRVLLYFFLAFAVISYLWAVTFGKRGNEPKL